ncbi:LacI family DNA-binding transcriptional regulator [Aestuariimicrobium soli]|uniref:LacI family DNA-binding transcriptional regulator n=1 Tax=Aestuariimicrobium soli TaxID=2035834 RepID=UPI003EBDBCF1
MTEKRRVGIRDVAERAGVSVATVSRILNDSYTAAPRTREKVAQAVRELGYVANPHARALTRPASAPVALVLRMLDDGFLLELTQTLTGALAEAGRLCLIATTAGDPERELQAVRRLRAQAVEAVVMIGSVVDDDAYQRGMADEARALAAAGGRLVLCARPPLHADLEQSVVQYDGEGGAEQAIAQLTALGHRRILQVSGPADQSITRERQRGWRRALEAADGDLDPALVVGPAWDRDSGRAVMEAVLANGLSGFTAVVAHTDQVAAGVLIALDDAGIRVPEDVSVVGFDDAAFAADLRLTTVRIPARELGLAAAQLALGQEPDAVMLPTAMVERSTTAPPRSHQRGQSTSPGR